MGQAREEPERILAIATIFRAPLCDNFLLAIGELFTADYDNFISLRRREITISPKKANDALAIERTLRGL